MNIVFFDGECGVCNRFVQFLLDHDPGHRLHYAPLQGEAAKTRFATPPDLSSVIFCEEEKIHFRSDAALRAIMTLGGYWSLMRVLLFVPRPLRNFAYDVVAKSRHRIFGTSSQCRLLSPDERRYFLP